MTSKHERIISQIMTTLAGADGVTGRVWRDRSEAFARAELPALCVYWEEAQLDPDTTCRGTWLIRVMVDILVDGGPVGQVADPIWCSVHSLLMADQTVGGHASGIEPFPRSMGNTPAAKCESVPGENQPGVLSTAWLVRARTMIGDITQ